jgi:HEAT repeat protein
VWWSNNRDRYLHFREPAQWAKVIEEAGSKSVTLYHIYEDLLKVLSDGLANNDHFIAFRAAIALGKAQDAINPSSSSQKAIEILKEANKTESRYFVRNNILLALGLANDTSSLEYIKDIVTNKSKKETPLRRCYAALASGYLTGNSELPKALREILNSNEDAEVKSSACLALGNLRDSASVTILGQALNASDGGKKREKSSVRAYAALALGRIGTDQALQELKKCTSMTEKESDVRAAVVIGLGMTALKEAREPLIVFLQQDKNQIVRGLSAISLAQLNDSSTYEVILEALQKNKFQDADGLFALALGLSGNEKAALELRKILDSKKSRLLQKAACAIGLGLLKDKESVPIISNLLKDEKQLNDVVLTPYLILSLGMIQDPNAAEILQKIWERADSRNAQLLAYHTNLAVSLTMLGKKEVVLARLVQQAAQRGNLRLKAYALHSLGLLADRETSSVFLETAKDADNYICYVTMSGIGFLLDGQQLNPVNKITANNVDIPMIIMDHIFGIPVW